MQYAAHQLMADGLRKLGVEKSFPLLHHFSSGKFASRALSLQRFCSYCDRKSDFIAGGENPQTIKRASMFVQLLQSGARHDDALAKAWNEFPLCTR